MSEHEWIGKLNLLLLLEFEVTFASHDEDEKEHFREMYRKRLSPEQALDVWIAEAEDDADEVITIR